jgi:hypothetical protein
LTSKEEAKMAKFVNEVRILMDGFVLKGRIQKMVEDIGLEWLLVLVRLIGIVFGVNGSWVYQQWQVCAKNEWLTVL